MSNAIFPALAGLAWDWDKSYAFKTLIQPSQNANEVRVATQAYPRINWKGAFEYLSEDLGSDDFNTLAGFFQQRFGAYDSFLLDDVIANPPDNYVVAQSLGVGDGVTTTFQLTRTQGGFTQPIGEVNLTDGTKPLLVYIGGVLQSSGYSVAPGGILTFTSAPGSSLLVSATFKYYWRVRFNDDNLDFRVMFTKIWEAQQVELIQVYE